MDRQEGAARIVGLDLLRIVSMVMIVALHILGQGGVLNGTGPGTAARFAAAGMECLFYCAVDCYGLLSGYVGSGGSRPYARLLVLWLEVVAYSLLFAAFFRWRCPQSVGREALLNALLPVMKRQYWYFTGYFGLALASPLLERCMKEPEASRADRRFFLLLVFFCLLPTVLSSDPFQLRGGYTMAWLVLLYLMGALLRRGRLMRRVGAVPLLLTAALCVGLTFLSLLYPLSVPGFPGFTLLSYTSPTVTVFAVCLLALFDRLRFGEGRGGKAVTALARCSFGVYILHTNPLLWRLVFLPDSLRTWAALPAALLVPTVVGASVAVYALCAGIDRLRSLAFRALRLRDLAERLCPWDGSADDS